ncbi:D-alanyl-D-alanine carboxypeptidase family protein [Thermodesulforhabdus norvegica]|uniref:serine-type D-Ala-D-Ala carboxypeptidase n=1 Tax=Thermodesulforhabdus norvegica TaxID=39841 RepID=A0A1I4U922_9BACT|nr:D-alanyl-D-alanine carboxypeptidase family protein [Thermodesulforhabdus norvegica]SFM85506.1 penicillin-binding protein 6. Serine peptidase. MEROPS family S11 [Thermodesulforhabdus norvegica]
MTRIVPISPLKPLIMTLIIFLTAARPLLAQGPSVESRSAVLIEPETGSIIYESNPDEKLPPASLTKIMTLYILFEAIERGDVKPDDLVFVSKNAWKTGGSRMFLEVGSRVPVRELIKGIAVASGNDACVAIAEHIAGSVEAFVNIMNQKAQKMGLHSTHFVNPHGLDDPEQYTTARDIARLASIYIRTFPQALEYHSMVEYTYNGITQYNRNRLLRRYPNVDGLKTGYVSRGGYHLVATAKRDGLRLIAVVMGAPKPVVRERDCAELLSFGFRSYTLIDPTQKIRPISVKVWKGVVDETQIIPEPAERILIRKIDADRVETRLNVPEEITAPVRAGEVVGSATFYLDGKQLSSVNLITKTAIAKAPWYTSILQSIKRKVGLFPREISVSAVAKAGAVIGGILLLAGFIRYRTMKRKKKLYSSRIRYF